MSRISDAKARLDLGRLLRAKRAAYVEQKRRPNVTIEDVADELEIHPFRLGRIETGLDPASGMEVRHLLTHYGSDQAEVNTAVELAKALRPVADQPRTSQAEWAIEMMAAREIDALVTAVGEVHLPSILYTPAYADYVFGQIARGDNDMQDRLLSLQLERAANPPSEVEVIVFEAALRGMAGPTAVVQAQLQHIADLAGSPDSSGDPAVRVVPMDDPATLERFADSALYRYLNSPDFTEITVDTRTGLSVVTDPTSIDRQLAVISRLQDSSVDPSLAATRILSAGDPTSRPAASVDAQTPRAPRNPNEAQIATERRNQIADLRSQIGGELRALRDASTNADGSTMKQVDLAGAIRVTRGAISGWENGHFSIPQVRARQILEHLAANDADRERILGQVTQLDELARPSAEVPGTEIASPSLEPPLVSSSDQAADDDRERILGEVTKLDELARPSVALPEAEGIEQSLSLAPGQQTSDTPEAAETIGSAIPEPPITPPVLENKPTIAHTPPPQVRPSPGAGRSPAPSGPRDSFEYLLHQIWQRRPNSDAAQSGGEPRPASTVHRLRGHAKNMDRENGGGTAFTDALFRVAGSDDVGQAWQRGLTERSLPYGLSLIPPQPRTTEREALRIAARYLPILEFALSSPDIPIADNPIHPAFLRVIARGPLSALLEDATRTEVPPGLGVGLAVASAQFAAVRHANRLIPNNAATHNDPAEYWRAMLVGGQPSLGQMGIVEALAFSHATTSSLQALADRYFPEAPQRGLAALEFLGVAGTEMATRDTFRDARKESSVVSGPFRELGLTRGAVEAPEWSGRDLRKVGLSGLVAGGDPYRAVRASLAFAWTFPGQISPYYANKVLNAATPEDLTSVVKAFGIEPKAPGIRPSAETVTADTRGIERVARAAAAGPPVAAEQPTLTSTDAATPAPQSSMPANLRRAGDTGSMEKATKDLMFAIAAAMDGDNSDRPSTRTLQRTLSSPEFAAAYARGERRVTASPKPNPKSPRADWARELYADIRIAMRGETSLIAHNPIHPAFLVESTSTLLSVHTMARNAGLKGDLRIAAVVARCLNRSTNRQHKLVPNHFNPTLVVTNFDAHWQGLLIGKPDRGLPSSEEQLPNLAECWGYEKKAYPLLDDILTQHFGADADTARIALFAAAGMQMSLANNGTSRRVPAHTDRRAVELLRDSGLEPGAVTKQLSPGRRWALATMHRLANGDAKGAYQIALAAAAAYPGAIPPGATTNLIDAATPADVEQAISMLTSRGEQLKVLGEVDRPNSAIDRAERGAADPDDIDPDDPNPDDIGGTRTPDPDTTLPVDGGGAARPAPEAETPSPAAHGSQVRPTPEPRRPGRASTTGNELTPPDPGEVLEALAKLERGAKVQTVAGAGLPTIVLACDVFDHLILNKAKDDPLLADRMRDAQEKRQIQLSGGQTQITIWMPPSALNDLGELPSDLATAQQAELARLVDSSTDAPLRVHLLDNGAAVLDKETTLYQYPKDSGQPHKASTIDKGGMLEIQGDHPTLRRAYFQAATANSSALPAADALKALEAFEPPSRERSETVPTQRSQDTSNNNLDDSTDPFHPLTGVGTTDFGRVPLDPISLRLPELVPANRNGADRAGGGMDRG